MKTSNKLLLAFVGLIVLLMLLSDTVMWANYKRGRSGDGLLTDDNLNMKRDRITTSAFKVLKIKGDVDSHLFIESDEKYQLLFTSDKNQQPIYTAQNDTLFIELKQGHYVTVRCPALQTVILSEGTGVDIQQLHLPELNILAGKSCSMRLVDMRVKVLDVQGGEENNFQATGNNSRIDSIHLQLGKSSVLKSYDVPYGHVSMSVDSLQDLQLTGESLTSMKQIQ